MKKATFIILSVGLLSCNSNIESKTIESENTDTIKPVVAESESQVPIILDSLSIGHELANAPFHNTSNIDYFKKHFKEVTKTEITLKKNEQDDNVTDTIKKVFWGKSYIETINNISINRLLLSYAIINDNNVVLKNNIRIGQSTQEVCETLKVKYDARKTYKYLELETTKDATGYLTFYFKDNKLNSIIYSPYTG